MALRIKSEGFGFMPSESEHHFLVTVSTHKKDDIYITEHYTWDDTTEQRQLSFALSGIDFIQTRFLR